MVSSLLRQATMADSAGIWAVRYAVRENTLRRGVLDDIDLRREIEDTGRGWVVELREEDEVRASGKAGADGQAGARIVAFAIGNAASGNIWALFVHPDAEGQGHGGRLHDTMLAWLWSQGLQRLWLTTGPDTRARVFYERRGWQHAGLTEHGEILFEQRR